MIDAIRKELIIRKNEINERIDTIYFGGGTPSLLSVDELQFLLDIIHENYRVTDMPEITLEANPDDLSKEKIIQLSKTRINRLSIGIQSFFDDDLKMMNRAHTAIESEKCLSTAMNHFENITIDLIYGIPNMSNEKWKQNLQKAINSGVPHISSYALTVEPKTALHNFIRTGKYPPLDDALAAHHFDILVEETSKHGFVQYEISNFGKPNYFSKHNISYWQSLSYLGIGPSAHSFNGEQRNWNISNNTKYIKSIQQNILPKEIEILSKKDQFNESVMIGLRTIWGVSLDQTELKFGSLFKKELLKNAEKHIENNTLEIKNKVLLITKKGKFFADGIASDLFFVQ
jgi:oxygen-independent coproporphyrinogen-3 oxidase